MLNRTRKNGDDGKRDEKGGGGQEKGRRGRVQCNPSQ